MLRTIAPIIFAIALLPGLSFGLTAADLVKEAPAIRLDVAQRAIDALGCAAENTDTIDKLIVVDMGMASRSKRLWAFDLSDPYVPRLVLNDRVAHGSGSDRAGKGIPSAFSNTPNSHMTSLGLYKVAESYIGKHGKSRRLDGLFARFNSNARERAVVMHPSNYVGPTHVGRSQGCPAVSYDTMQALEKAGLDHAVLWIDGPDQTLTAQVEECARKREARVAAQRSIDMKPAMDLAWGSVLALDFGSVQTFALREPTDRILVEALPENVDRPVDRLLAAIENPIDEIQRDPFEVNFLMTPAVMYPLTPWFDFMRV